MAIIEVDYSSLDFVSMSENIGLKPKHIPILLATFLEESDKIIKALEDAIVIQSYSAIKQHSHSLKGSSGNLKFEELYSMAKEMEFAAANTDQVFEYMNYLRAIKKAIGTISI